LTPGFDAFGHIGFANYLAGAYSSSDGIFVELHGKTKNLKI